MEKLNLINGNKQNYSIDLPKLVMVTKHINDVALNHIAENTGLNFVKCFNGYEAQPTNSRQLAALFITYNFKTQYQNNGSNRNTLFLKSDYDVGFKVNSICYSCCVDNGININGLTPGDKLSC